MAKAVGKCMNFYLSKNGQKSGLCSVKQIQAFLIQACVFPVLLSQMAGTTLVPAVALKGMR